MYTLQPNLPRDKGGAEIPDEAPMGRPSPTSPDDSATSPVDPVDRESHDSESGGPPSKRVELLGTLFLVLGPFLLFALIILLDRLIR